MPQGQLELAYAPYRLLFKRPFGTAHGIRTGTDSVFVRLRRGDHVGYGEATLPPYLDETQLSVIQEFACHDIKRSLQRMAQNAHWRPELRSAAANAALSMAYYDMVSREKGVIASSILIPMVEPHGQVQAMVTLGLVNMVDIRSALQDLPYTEVLKVKLNGVDDEHYVKEVLRWDDRKLFLDANQCWTTLDQAMAVLQAVGEERLAGIEQPFKKDRWDLHGELHHRTQVTVYGDESIQGPEDLERAAGVFGGVNIKLMKCGGLDVAVGMAQRAHALGMRVMLGCMSESSLGCGAMAQLAPLADLVDLDGPWLLSNDPFEGLYLDHGRIACTGTTGFGVRPVLARLPEWTYFGA